MQPFAQFVKILNLKFFFSTKGGPHRNSIPLDPPVKRECTSSGRKSQTNPLPLIKENSLIWEAIVEIRKWKSLFTGKSLSEGPSPLNFLNYFKYRIATSITVIYELMCTYPLVQIS